MIEWEFSRFLLCDYVSTDCGILNNVFSNDKQKQNDDLNITSMTSEMKCMDG